MQGHARSRRNALLETFTADRELAKALKGKGVESCNRAVTGRSDHQEEWGARLIIAELNLNGSERVLDLGCGDGSTTAQIAALLPEGEVLGIDASSPV